MWKTDLAPIDYAGRRKFFLGKLKNAVAVFPSSPESIRNGNVHHPYRQDSNFCFLTGFEEPNSLCLLTSESKTPFQLFVTPRDKQREIWEGKMLGLDGAKKETEADVVLASTPDQPFDIAFIEALQTAEVLYYRFGVNSDFDLRMLKLLKRAKSLSRRKGAAMWPIFDPSEILDEMRLFKTKPEIARLQIAANITGEAHLEAMKITKPGMFEYEVEAILYHAFRIHGASRLGYQSIVASGPNACVLHHRNHTRRLLEKDLVLIDAAAEFDYYTADVTRTFPISGNFSPEQREVYLAVLKAQKNCIRMAKPGQTLRGIHEHATEVLTEELRKLKVLKGTTASLLKKRAYLTFYPHGTSHWLGMDVHDTGTYFGAKWDVARKLEPGMVFTIEPGLYFSPDSGPARYRGIGVRIEDDILITAGGCKVLTSGIPKEIDEVESLCSQP